MKSAASTLPPGELFLVRADTHGGWWHKDITSLREFKPIHPYFCLFSSCKRCINQHLTRWHPLFLAAINSQHLPPVTVSLRTWRGFSLCHPPRKTTYLCPKAAECEGNRSTLLSSRLSHSWGETALWYYDSGCCSHRGYFEGFWGFTARSGANRLFSPWHWIPCEALWNSRHISVRSLQYFLKKLIFSF